MFPLMTLALKNNLELLRKDFNRLRSIYHVKRIGIFGSYSRNKQKKKSDVDILIEFSEPVSLFSYIELKNHLSKLLNKKVDLVTKKALKPIIKKDILEETIYA